MATNFTLPVELPPLRGLGPAADAAGRTGATYIDTGKYHKLFAVFHLNQGNAATIACSLANADDAAGTGTAAVAVSGAFQVYTNLDLAAGFTFARQTDAATYTTDAAVKEKVVVLVIDPAKLVKRFIAPVTGASNAANITSCQIYGVPRAQAL